jgi:5S rRNA maturation endonuclease (ribonuclease M5)
MKGIEKMNENTERLKPYLLDYIQEITQKSKGKDQYVCPFCNSGTGRNATGAFTYYPDTHTYNCFACGENGNIFTLHAKLNNLSLNNDFPQIVDDLEKKFNLSQTSKSEPWIQLRTHVYQNMNHDKIATKTIYHKPDGSKTAVWHRYEGNTLVKGLNGLKMPLYHVYNLSDNTKPVFIVEGEKDVETMEKLGYIATTSPNGAGSHWRKDYIEYFRGFDVIILADNDDVGLKYATEIAENVIQIARSVKLVPSQALYMPLKPKGDISDIVECIGSAKTTKLIEGVLNSDEYIFTPPLSELKKDNSNKKKPDFDDFSLFDDFMLRHGYSIRYNQITHCYEFVGFGKQESPEHLAENVPTILYDQLRKEYSKVNMMSIMNYITLHATRNRYNPVLDMIKAEKWDGKDRVTDIYNIFRIPADDTLSRTLIYKWLIQSVCGLFNNIENPFSLDIVLVFQGNQGIGKTRFLEKLALHPKFFAEGCCIDPRNKDSIMLATNKWICELGEIGSTMKKDIDSVKAFLSRSTDEYRTPYGKAMLQYPRITSFVGTVNDEQFLVDQTGNRRFATVPLPSDLEIDYETQIKPFNSIQLWSQIYQTVKNSDKASCFRLTTEEKKLLDERNQHFMKPLRAEEEVLDILDKLQREEDGYICSTKKMTVTEFMRENDLTKFTSAEIGKILKKHGYISKLQKINGTPTRVLELPVKYSGNPYN